MNLALNPFDEGKRPEHVSRIDVEIDEAIKEYLGLFNDPVIFNNFSPTDVEYFDLCKQLVSGYKSLTPSQVYLLTGMLSKELLGHEHFGGKLTSVIQKSYDNGHNNFELDIFDTTPCFLGCSLKAEGSRRLRLVINGRAGDLFGRNAENVDFIINGDLGLHFSYGSVNCLFSVTGKVGAWYSGGLSKESRYRVRDRSTYEYLKKGPYRDLVELIE